MAATFAPIGPRSPVKNPLTASMSRGPRPNKGPVPRWPHVPR
jgi:hypothetical protein